MFKKSNYQEFEDLSLEYNLIPVYECIPADMITPVLAYLKIRQEGVFSFLLESVEDSLNFGRYSFIGVAPSVAIFNHAALTFRLSEGKTELIEGRNIFQVLKDELLGQKQPFIEGLPYFKGGAVGFIGYENTELIEPTLGISVRDKNCPDSYLGIFNELIVFDHLNHQIIIIVNKVVKKDSDKARIFKTAAERIRTLKKLLNSPAELPTTFRITKYEKNEINLSEFNLAFDKIKNHILDGDVFQLVLSEKFSAQFEGDSVNVYRALRMINPSPYMYVMEFPGEMKVIGTSPEDLVKVQGNKATILPIAGTRKRGSTPQQDIAFAEELLADPKENAEHTMLVDLARNDLGRVCRYGTVSLKEDRVIKMYSHVMHIVSRVDGEIPEGTSPVDVLTASFPAGTVTGAPKVRAMEIIKNLEHAPRGLYAGAAGYFDFSGNMDLCIAIRSFFIQGKTISWQAGAGIVLDSKPELEVKEIYNKARVLVEALKQAGRIDENLSY